MVKAMQGGINVIDMASSYDSEIIVKAALTEVASGTDSDPIEREDLVLTTKVGYVQSQSQFEAVRDLGLKMLKIDGQNGYCLHPLFIKH